MLPEEKVFFLYGSISPPHQRSLYFMNNTTMRFLYYLSFLTSSIGLALSQSWLVWFGIACMTYTSAQLHQQQPKVGLLWLCLALALFDLMPGGRAFAWTPPKWEELVVVSGIILWMVVCYFRQRQTGKMHERTH